MVRIPKRLGINPLAIRISKFHGIKSFEARIAKFLGIKPSIIPKILELNIYWFKVGVSNGWVWVGIKWVGPLKPNNPFNKVDITQTQLNPII